MEYDIEEVKSNSEDKQKFMEYVKSDGLLLEWASPELQDDKELVLEAVRCDGGALEFASDRLKNDKEVLLDAVEIKGWLLLQELHLYHLLVFD